MEWYLPIYEDYYFIINPEALAEWFHRQDCRVIKADSFNWVEVNRFIVHSYPLQGKKMVVIESSVAEVVS